MPARVPGSSPLAPKSGLPRPNVSMPRYVVRLHPKPGTALSGTLFYLSDGESATTMRSRAREFVDRTTAVETLQSLNSRWQEEGEVYP